MLARSLFSKGLCAWIAAAGLIGWMGSPPSAHAGWACDMANYAPNFVRAAQNQLTEKGHDPGPIDGEWGRKSASALSQFQKAQGLPATEVFDQPTIDALFGADAGITVHVVELPERTQNNEQAFQRLIDEAEADTQTDVLIFRNWEGFSEADYLKRCTDG